MPEALAAGARFVLIDRTLARLDLSPAQVGLPLNWRFGPASRDLGHESYVGRTQSIRGVGRRPLTPVHIKGVRTGSDLAISWIRRTRTGGDSWDAVEVPLGEDIERYEVDIVSGVNVVRTLTSSTTDATYTAAQQTADLGSPKPAIAVRVYQLSTLWGRGAPAEAIL